MIAAVCIDDRNGLLFNRRRLSRDRAQQEDLLALCGKKPLWLAPYSAPLFDWAPERVRVEEKFLEQAAPGDICFVEDRPLPAEKLEGLILYRWNRAYPSDVRLELDLSQFALTERAEFSGTSHETITRERYTRKED